MDRLNIPPLGWLSCTLILVGLVALPTTTRAAETFECSAVSGPIQFGTTLVDTIEISDAFLIGDVHVCVDVSHPWVGDVQITLTSPSGTVVPLYTGAGGSDDDLSLTFCSQGPSYGSVATTCQCVMQPADPGAMASLAGEPAAGVWTLTVDDIESPDDGVLNGWCLRLFDFGIGCFDPVPSCAGIGDDVIVREEASTGLVASAEAIRDSLVNLGHSPGIIDDLGWLTALSPRRVWVSLGTFPDNHILSLEEGQILADLAISGISIYVESADAWAYDPQTPFEDYDGVENQIHGGLFDGDDSLLELDGLNSGYGVNLAGFSRAYTQDQAGFDYNDHLIPSVANPDLGGADGGTIWLSGTLPSYPVATFYASDFGPVIASSFEFGGIGGNRDLVMERYLNGLPLAPLGPQFRRGDCNSDGSYGLPDSVAILHYLFLGTVTPTCDDACDWSDNGVIDVTDAVGMLDHLFSGGTPPPAPYPVCGSDSTSDSLDCGWAPGC